jgi:molybdopterin-containing oxidoreductase family membrane subunit
MNKVMLATGLIVAYAYSVEFFTAWYSQHYYEQFAFVNRVIGASPWAFFAMFTCNVFAPQILWFKWARTNLVITFIVANFVNAGMWFERFVIIVTSLQRDFLASSWGMFVPSWVDLCMLAGSFGLFLTLFALFLKFLPIIAMAEVKTVMPAAHAHGHESPDEERVDYRPDETAHDRARRHGHGDGGNGHG